MPVTVVVVSGTWTGEGQTTYRTDALPVVQDENGNWLVEPAAFDPAVGGRIELRSPTPGQDGLGGLPPDGEIEASAAGNGTFFFSLEDGWVVEVPGAPSGGGVRGRWDPPGEMASRTHLLVVAYVDGDTVTAVAGTFAVEG